MTRRRVLVVGAGSSGLAAVQQALAAGLVPVCIEARPGVGGAWRYDPNPGKAQLRWTEDGWLTIESPEEGTYTGEPPPSPMYDSLRTNVPTTLMQFRGRPFPPTVGLFAHHQQVQDYLEDFAKPLLNYPTMKWESDQFDAVFVANGHYSRPYIPFTPGLRSFGGELSHARWYRQADQFLNKTVLVVGNSASGYDITRELAASIHKRRVANPRAPLPRIYQAARSPPALGIPWDAPDAPEYSTEVHALPPIRHVNGRRIEFENDEVIEDVDVIIFATGYYFSFPFLSPTNEPFASNPLTYSPTKDGKRGVPSGADGGIRMHGLDDRLLFYLADPTMVFLALPYLTIPFPLAQLQARLAALHFADSPLLPAPLTFSPDPSCADPETGEPDGAPESRKPVTWAEPRGRQYDMMDRMMRESGDVARSEGQHDTDCMVDAMLADKAEHDYQSQKANSLGLTSQAERDLRIGAKALRKAVLGY